MLQGRGRSGRAPLRAAVGAQRTRSCGRGTPKVSVIQRPQAVESPDAGAHAQQWTREGRPLLRHPREDSPASDANPAKRIASEKEEQGSERNFRREAEAESSGLCDDAIPQAGA